MYANVIYYEWSISTVSGLVQLEVGQWIFSSTGVN